MAGIGWRSITEPAASMCPTRSSAGPPRRPTPARSRLPTNVVIDLTTWGYLHGRFGQRLTSSHPGTLAAAGRTIFTGYRRHRGQSRRDGRAHHDLFEPRVVRHGGVVLSTSGWPSGATCSRRTPTPPDARAAVSARSPGRWLPARFVGGAELKGEYRLVTLFTRTGQITTNETVPFDNPLNPAAGTGTYNTNLPFMAAQQGIRGTHDHGRCMSAQCVSDRRRGITLTEILIAIMIMGIGLVSLATLFPIGLLRLRDATRWYALGDLDPVGRRRRHRARAAHQPVVLTRRPAQLSRQLTNPPCWYPTADAGRYNPLTQDTPSYYGAWSTDSTTRPLLGASLNGIDANASRQPPSRWARAAVRLRPALAVPDRSARLTARRATTWAIPSRPASARGRLHPDRSRTAAAWPAPTACSG